MREHGGASDLGLDKRLKGGAADLYGASALVDRAPRCQVTMASAEAGSTASFKANHEGEAVAGDFSPGMVRLCPEFFSHSVTARSRSVPALCQPVRRTGVALFRARPIALALPWLILMRG